jgi:hypothetical protein
MLARRTTFSTMLLVALGAAAGVACGTHHSTPNPAGVPWETPLGTDGQDAAAGTGGTTGLPCDVQKVLEDACIACHGGSQAPPMLSYGDLVAASPSYPGQTVAQRALARMTATTSPMPPPPAIPPTAAEIATFQTWVNAGTPMGGACASSGPTSTGNYNTPTTCSSTVTVPTWTGGDGSGSMAPGEACLACHQQHGGPRFAVGGTVYLTAHEPNDCKGDAATNLQVIVTDKNGQVVTMKVNSAGNFYSSGVTLAPPFTAKVTDGTNTRAMSGAVTAGDCNSCHTEQGANGAPGRIMAP